MVEEYDAVIMLRVNCNTYTYSKLLFFRNKRIIAERWFNEDFFYAAVGDKFVIFWREHGWPAAIDRSIIANELFEFTVENEAKESTEWWQMQNVMTNLEEPPEQEP